MSWTPTVTPSITNPKAMKASPLPRRPLRITASPATSSTAAATKMSQATTGIQNLLAVANNHAADSPTGHHELLDAGKALSKGVCEREGLPGLVCVPPGATAARGREAQTAPVACRHTPAADKPPRSLGPCARRRSVPRTHGGRYDDSGWPRVQLPLPLPQCNSTTNPVTPSSITSGTEPLRQAMTGVPQAMASIITRPNGSGQSMGNSRA